MQMCVTFKTPDVINNQMSGLFYDEEADFEEEKKMQDLVEKFVRYGELITIEFDSEAGTATVMEK